MYSPNPEWSKLILIALAKHFKQVADDNGYYFHIVGTDDYTSSHPIVIELNVEGPIITQKSINNFKLLFGVQVHYSTKIVNHYLNRFIIEGKLQEAFTLICVDGLGSLKPVEEIVTNYFGEAKSTRNQQGSVESVFEIYLTN